MHPVPVARAGAEAMREAAIEWCAANCRTDVEMDAIRALLLPEDK